MKKLFAVCLLLVSGCSMTEMGAGGDTWGLSMLDAYRMS